MKRILLNSFLVLLCLFLYVSLTAQFKNRAALQPVTKTGFYSIAVSPELSSFLKTDFSDLRILDQQKRQASYLLRTDSNSPSLYTPNPPTNFKQKDSSDSFTYLFVSGKLPFHISRINLQVNGPQFFKREVEVLIPHQQSYNFTISSDTLVHFSVPAFKSKEWLVKIFNGDNPPLIIKKITTEQEGRKIICWLDSGKSYHLEMNDSNARTPQYDLQSFIDRIPAAITPIHYTAVEPLIPGKSNTNKTFFTSTWLWVVIIMVLVGLLYFTWSLTREIRNIEKPS